MISGLKIDSKPLMRSPLATFFKYTSLGCLILFFLGNAIADQSLDKRIALFAKLPDWSGVWESIPLPSGSPPNDPSYTAAWLQKHIAHKSSVEPSDNTTSRCVWGMPRLVKTSHDFEVMVLPEQTVFSYDINEFRHVWTDGRKHPVRASVTPTGHSIGHWEGSTLVIETIAMQPGLWINPKGGTLSPKATIEERWTQIDADHLKVDMTVRDSVALAKPWVLSRKFQRAADNNRLTQRQCFEEPHPAANKEP
jgi:hypothetical protein